jgi:hypothetical protein
VDHQPATSTLIAGGPPTGAQSLPSNTSGDVAVPYCAGASVDGEPTKDHRDLAAASPLLAKALKSISSRRRDRTEPVTPVKATVSVASGVDVEVKLDVTGLVQVGVSALRGVYEWIPEMPAVGILGTDHFQKGLLYRAHLPVYRHPLTAFHKYEPARANQTKTAHLGTYVVSELRHAVLNTTGTSPTNRLTEAAHNCSAPTAISDPTCTQTPSRTPSVPARETPTRSSTSSAASTSMLHKQRPVRSQHGWRYALTRCDAPGLRSSATSATRFLSSRTLCGCGRSSLRQRGIWAGIQPDPTTHRYR